MLIITDISTQVVVNRGVIDMKKLCSFVLVVALVASVFAMGGKDAAPALSGKP